MKEPAFDRSGYPTEETLEAIRQWPASNFSGLCEFVLQAWDEYGQSEWVEGKSLKLITGGWSGNEDVISALSDNLMFWSACWVSSERGGLHVFRWPEAATDPPVYEPAMGTGMYFTPAEIAARAGGDDAGEVTP